MLVDNGVKKVRLSLKGRALDGLDWQEKEKGMLSMIMHDHTMNTGLKVRVEHVTLEKWGRDYSRMAKSKVGQVEWVQILEASDFLD